MFVLVRRCGNTQSLTFCSSENVTTLVVAAFVDINTSAVCVSNCGLMTCLYVDRCFTEDTGQAQGQSQNTENAGLQARYERDQ